MIRKAQALVELAIFGSLLLMLLGVILSYGLRYGLQQKTMMHAFRKALELSGDESQGGQASYLYIQDRHIPNPANPWGIGSTVPFQASASVIRSYKLHETADNYRELPQLTIEIKGSQGSKIYTYKTAGLRKESVVCSNIDRYYEVYGSAVGGGDECQEEGKENATVTITIVDSCEGELLSYDGCKRQCRMITDSAYCERECERAKLPDSNRNCHEVCQKPINIPWYCNNLDNLFSFAIAKNKPKAMGVQPDYRKETTINSQLNIAQEGNVISTSDNINWQDNTTREIVYLYHLNQTTGEAYPATSANIRNESYTNVVEESTVWDCSDGVCR